MRWISNDDKWSFTIFGSEEKLVVTLWARLSKAGEISRVYSMNIWDRMKLLDKCMSFKISPRIITDFKTQGLRWPYMLNRHYTTQHGLIGMPRLLGVLKAQYHLFTIGDKLAARTTQLFGRFLIERHSPSINPVEHTRFRCCWWIYSCRYFTTTTCSAWRVLITEEKDEGTLHLYRRMDRWIQSNFQSPVIISTFLREK